MQNRRFVSSFIQQDHSETIMRLVVIWGRSNNGLKMRFGLRVLPVIKEVKQEAKRRKIKLVILPTKKAIQELKQAPSATNAILHVTC
jgi:hypothetical protein